VKTAIADLSSVHRWDHGRPGVTGSPLRH